MNKFVNKLKKIANKVIESLKNAEEQIGESIIFIGIAISCSLLSVESDITFNIIVLTLCYLVTAIGLVFIKMAGRRKERDFPVPLKRFTRYENGYIEVKESDLDDAIIYLYDLEEYLRKEGARNVK